MSDRNDRHEHDDRMGLEAFDRVDVPDQWDDITRRAEGVEVDSTAPASGRRRTPATWFMAAAAIALVAVAAVAVSVRSGDDSAPAPATTPDETLPTPATTLSSPTSPTSPTSPREPTVADDLVELRDWTGSTVGAATEDLLALGLRYQLVEVDDENAGHDVVVAWSVLGDADAGPRSLVPSGSVVELTVAVSPESDAPPPDTVPDADPDVAGGAAVTAWNPDCVERLGENPERFSVPAAADRFTTLGSEPSLDIGLPVVDTDAGPVTPYLQTAVVPGGVALAMHEFADGAEVLAVVIVDDDGSVRWRRCLEGAGWGSALIPAGSELWVATDDDTTSLRAFDLATGSDFSAPFTVGHRVVQDVSGQRLLVGASWTSPAIESSDRLGVVDLDGFAATDIPYPDLAIGDAPDVVRYELIETVDELLVAGTSMSSSVPDLVWTGEAWSSDPADLRRLPPTLDHPFGSDEPLQLLDGAGEVIWSVPGFRGISREGFNSAITDSVVLVMECLTWTDDLGCQWVDDTPPEEQLVAFDLQTGERLWARPGGQAFAAIEGDRGIVTSAEGWELIDLRTGERVDDQPVTAWPQSDIFANECCGAGDYIWTRLDGGVLFESLGDRLRVWFPPEASTPTVTTAAFS
ncbi:MAG: hypothetical protein CL424_10280 [Acidimicrobiaceae bacterium]|nr:hypothetical protein [Acidimicrobiaceae bacterium]